MKINILMSTYNGEKFLAEQIESIQKQTVTDWTLLIRDDGSSDRTPEIIQEFVAKDSRIRFINADHRVNYGVIKNFFTLLKHEEADFYFFSDQDDVWLPDKMAIQLQEAQKYDQEIPLAVYMDLKVVDQDLNVINESMIRSQSGHANTKMIQELSENAVTGGVMLINHALAEKWLSPDGIIMHDWYLALLAASLGKLIYIDLPGELYRQHSNNVLGARTLDKRFKILREGPRHIFTRYWKLIHESQQQAQKILETESTNLASKDREVLRHYIDIDQQVFTERLRRIIKYKYTKNQWKHIIVFRLLLLTNLYNAR
ncbi:alpha-L-Rha alpha-1,3-L-rhamnosyltransferase [Streptococcus penaeicida]|uniref:Alpha-L-Rha alpha-1,3-L-rhamnosyltransferase n=1 Tax=Streptococcus penaeicida TaxID=1765960 RepID=A0A2N8LDE9_9STRE|nr:glycosyltransferase family 2 protein [Streptococcus penaeicida]PND48182.1 alpha-L-Rha alpha-1,3-L-rhamnosyltransferase [Streptococcus penaeicida]